MNLVAPTSRKDLLLGMIQKQFPNYHPLVAIAEIAHNGEADLKLQFECHRTIAKYVEPELKSIEVKSEIQGQARVRVSMFEPVEAEFSEIEDSTPGGVTVRDELRNW